MTKLDLSGYDHYNPISFATLIDIRNMIENPMLTIHKTHTGIIYGKSWDGYAIDSIGNTYLVTLSDFPLDGSQVSVIPVSVGVGKDPRKRNRLIDKVIKAIRED